MPAANPDTKRKMCSGPECDQSIADHAWGHIKADGWLQQKDGRIWCPAHIPEWYAGWKLKKTWYVADTEGKIVGVARLHRRKETG